MVCSRLGDRTLVFRDPKISLANQEYNLKKGKRNILIPVS